MTTDEISGKPRVPKEELEELVDKWDDPEWAQRRDYYAEIGLHIAADELEALIERYDYE